MNPKEKTALVTGGAHRVGKAIAMELARAGANIVINYHSSVEAAEKTALEIRDLGAEAMMFQADVTKHEQIAAMAAAARERFGAVDILVNSASIFKRTPIPTNDFADWHYVTDILINGPLYCANAVVPMMLEKGAGVIINIIDLSAWEPWPEYAAHCVGKTALLALTRQFALEFAPQVRANAVAPGPVLPPPDYDEEKIARTGQKTLLERWGKAGDVARTVRFLVESDYITGEVITVDGGERFGHRKDEEG